MPQKIIKPLDFAVMIAVALLAAASAIPLFASGRTASGRTAGGQTVHAPEASVLYDDGVIAVPLSRDCVFQINSGGYTLEITVSDG